MVPILFNKLVCESSYNDLKFRVWNLNYFFTNLRGSQYKKNNGSDLPERMIRFIIFEVL